MKRIRRDPPSTLFDLQNCVIYSAASAVVDQSCVTAQNNAGLTTGVEQK